MLLRTGTRAAPWVVVRSNDKQSARLNTMRVILRAVDYKNRDPRLDFTPDPRIVVSGADEVALMRAERNRSGSVTGSGAYFERYAATPGSAR